MNQKLNCFLSVTLCLLLTMPANAQQREFVHKNFTQEDGLPSNENYEIFQDSKKYIWIASDLGVSRYDGNRFQTFNLPDNVIFKIREDRHGRIWFFSHKGLLAYFENEKMHPYRFNENIRKTIDKIHVIDAMVDDSDNIYLSSSLDNNYTISANGNITTINHNQWGKQVVKFNIVPGYGRQCFTQRFVSTHSSSDSLQVNIQFASGKKQYTIYHPMQSATFYGAENDSDGSVYFFCGQLLLQLMPNGDYRKTDLGAEILSITNHGNKIWVGLRKEGVRILNKDLSKISSNNILDKKTVSSVCFDFEGGIWFSTTENGVFYIKNHRISRIALKGPYDGVDRLYNYKDSILIFNDRSGLYKIKDTAPEQILQLDNTHIYDIHPVSENQLLVFNATQQLEFKTVFNRSTPFNTFRLYPAASSAAFLHADAFFMSTTTIAVQVKMHYEKNGGYYSRPIKKGIEYPVSMIYAPDKYQLLNRPVSVFLDSHKNLWGAGSDGIYKGIPPYDTLVKTGLKNPLFENGLNHIRELDNNWMAVSVRSGGVALFQNPDSSVNITESDGLLSNKVRYLLPVKNQLWVATAKGISVIQFSSYNPIRYTIKNIGRNDGFFNLTINQLVQYKSYIVAATSVGIFFIDSPQEIINHRYPDIPFYITSISSYKGDTTNISSISIPYEKNRLSIKYRAICFNDNEKLQYLYQFGDADTIWHSTANTERLIENLEPGTYVLKLKASIPEQQRYSGVQSITIIIQKPWWQNNWFRLLIVLMVSAVIYLGVRTWIRKIKKEARQKTALHAKLAELEQTALRAQMNPHFIFNCLTSIQQLIISGNKIDANEYLVKFSRLIRKTLEISAQPFISIQEEINYLKEYLELEQLRLFDRFDFSITTDPAISTLSTFIPNMMLQPVVENCVRHGIKSLESRKGLITVHFSIHDNLLIATVTDNGTGRRSVTEKDQRFKEHKSYGMEIVRKRLAAFAENNKCESTVAIRDLYDASGNTAGTQVILQMPFKQNI